MIGEECHIFAHIHCQTRVCFKSKCTWVYNCHCCLLLSCYVIIAGRGLVRVLSSRKCAADLLKYYPTVDITERLSDPPPSVTHYVVNHLCVLSSFGRICKWGGSLWSLHERGVRVTDCFLCVCLPWYITVMGDRLLTLCVIVHLSRVCCVT